MTGMTVFSFPNRVYHCSTSLVITSHWSPTE